MELDPMSAPAVRSPRRRLKVVCPHDCPDTCVMTVDVEDGRAVAHRRRPRPPLHPGLPLRQGQPLPRARLQPRPHPAPAAAGRARRARAASSASPGTRRSTRSRRACAGIADAHGPQAILPYSYAGNMGLLSATAAWTAASSTRSARACSTAPSARSPGAARLQGHGREDDRASTPRRSSTRASIVAWGANIVSSNVHLWPFVEEARRRGARLVAIDPYRSRTAEKADRHLAPLPGNGRRARAGDDARRSSATASRTATTSSGTRSGREELRARARGVDAGARRRRRPACAADEIEAFAREYATTRPSAIRLNYGLNRHAGGGMAVRTIACLPAVVGAWRDVGRRGAALHLGHLPGRTRTPWSGPTSSRRARAPST